MMPRRQPRRPSIGFISAIASICASSLRFARELRRRRRPAHSACDDLDLELARGVEELVQRRVEQADRDGQPVHRLEDAEEVVGLDRRAAWRARLSRRASSSARIMSWTICFRSPRNMCSVRHRPMPAAPNSRPSAASSGVSALARTPIVRNSSAHARIGVEVAGDLGLDERDRAEHDDAGGAVDRDDVALVQHDVGAAHARDLVLGVDLERLGAAHARLAHAAGDDRRVRRLAAVAGEDALRGDHAVQVVGGGLPAHEDDLAALLRRPPRRRRP